MNTDKLEQYLDELSDGTDFSFEKSVSTEIDDFGQSAEVCAESFRGLSNAFKTMGESINQGYTRYIGNSDKMTEQEFKEALKMKNKKGEY